MMRNTTKTLFYIVHFLLISLTFNSHCPLFATFTAPAQINPRCLQKVEDSPNRYYFLFHGDVVVPSRPVILIEEVPYIAADGSSPLPKGTLWCTVTLDMSGAYHNPLVPLNPINFRVIGPDGQALPHGLYWTPDLRRVSASSGSLLKTAGDVEGDDQSELKRRQAFGKGNGATEWEFWPWVKYEDRGDDKPPIPGFFSLERGYIGKYEWEAPQWRRKNYLGNAPKDPQYYTPKTGAHTLPPIPPGLYLIPDEDTLCALINAGWGGDPTLLGWLLDQGYNNLSILSSRSTHYDNSDAIALTVTTSQGTPLLWGRGIHLTRTCTYQGRADTNVLELATRWGIAQAREKGYEAGLLKYLCEGINDSILAPVDGWNAQDIDLGIRNVLTQWPKPDARNYGQTVEAITHLTSTDAWKTLDAADKKLICALAQEQRHSHEVLQMLGCGPSPAEAEEARRAAEAAFAAHATEESRARAATAATETDEYDALMQTAAAEREAAGAAIQERLAREARKRAETIEEETTAREAELTAEEEARQAMTTAWTAEIPTIHRQEREHAEETELTKRAALVTTQQQERDALLRAAAVKRQQIIEDAQRKAELKKVIETIKRNGDVNINSVATGFTSLGTTSVSYKALAGIGKPWAILKTTEGANLCIAVQKLFVAIALSMKAQHKTIDAFNANHQRFIPEEIGTDLRECLEQLQRIHTQIGGIDAPTLATLGALLAWSIGLLPAPAAAGPATPPEPPLPPDRPATPPVQREETTSSPLQRDLEALRAKTMLVRDRLAQLRRLAAGEDDGSE